MTSRKASLTAVLAFAAAALLAACGAGPTPTGDCLEPNEDGTFRDVPCEAGGTPVATPTPTPGQTNGTGGDGLAVLRGSGCGGCHTIQGVPGAQGQVGPNLTNIGSVAATRKPGMPAEDYIRESIVEPGAFIVDGFQNLMPPNFGTLLSPRELDALVEYLASLR